MVMSDTIRYFLGEEDDLLVGLVRALGLAACAAITGFLMFTIAVGRYGNWTQYQVVLALVLAAIFFLFPGPLARFSRRADALLSFVLAGLGVYAAWYMIDQHAEIAAYREGLPNSSDIFVYVTGTLIVLEAARRAEGWILLSIVAVAVAYLLAGPWLPGILSHRGMDTLQVAELFYSQQGIFGVALGSVVDIVYIYVIFGATLRHARPAFGLRAMLDHCLGPVRFHQWFGIRERRCERCHYDQSHAPGRLQPCLRRSGRGFLVGRRTDPAASDGRRRLHHG